jgi:hypothetical protein
MSAHDRTHHANQTLAAFYAQNPDFDLLTADLHQLERQATQPAAHASRSADRAAEHDGLNLDGLDAAATFAALKTSQRLTRIHPDRDTVQTLLGHDFDSAHAIAAVSQHRFVRDYAETLGGGEQAAAIHRRAVAIKTQTQQLWANVKDLVAAPHYRATAFANVDPALTAYFEELPSYQDLFGSLDYCECPHCASIFGPAAYFVDMMRIIDEYITLPNTATIKPGMKLAERRPDLFTLPLTCEQTNTIAPYLQIVNTVLEQRLAKDSQIQEPFKTLAAAIYPFNLPFTLPLTELRLYLGKLQTSLFSIYSVFQAPDTPPYPDTVDLWRESVGLSIEAFRLVTTPDATLPGLSRAFGYDDIVHHLFFQGDGQVQADKGGATLHGNADTRFTIQLLPGAQIGVGDVFRTVVTIADDHTLTVADPWPDAFSGQVYTVAPADALDRVEVFQERTSLSREQLVALLTESLSPSEISAGAAAQLFINQTGESQPSMQIVAKTSDPRQPFEQIVGLTPARLDRLNRFIRLAAALGWAYSDLDWTLRISVPTNTEITADAIVQIGQTRLLQTTLPAPVDVVGSLRNAALKAVGRVSDSNPQDLFDRVFNNPALLNGKSPYSDSSVPFAPTAAPQWTVADRSDAKNLLYRTRLVAALQVSDNDLTKVAGYLLQLQGIASGALTLDSATLGWLYRLTKLPALLRLTLDQYLVLLALLYFPDQPYLAPPANGVPATLDALRQQQATAAWLAEAPFTVYQLYYSLTGVRTPQVNPGYSEEQIKPFIQNLATISAGSRLTAAALAFEDIDADDSAALFNQLKSAGIINDLGVFSSKARDYTTLAALFPIADGAFTTNAITLPESREAFTKLADNGLIITSGQGATTGALSAAFTAETSLAFLFPNDPKADLKRGQVRAVLLQIRRDIDHSLDVLQTVARLQQANALNGLADFLNATPEHIAVLLPFAITISDLSEYLQELLTPLSETAQPSDKIKRLIATLSRALMIATLVELTDAELTAIVSAPQRFNISQPAKLTLANVQSLTTFKALVRAFNDTDNRLIRCYFQIGSDTTCAADPVAALAALTGWDQRQIERLIAFFWPNGGDSATVGGVARLKQAFDLSAQTGADIYLLLQLSALAELPIANGPQLIDANWQTYQRLAQSTLGLVNARFKDAEFDKLYAALTSQLNLAKRDALVGFTIWHLHHDFSFINQPSDLYQYLLIDVEMSDCDMIAPMAEAIAAVQLYMQRARMMLEDGVTDLSHIRDIWWEWMSSYRVWEANRKIFLYPENYLDPSLRSTATPLFRQLVDALLQTNISDDSVMQAYMEYFEGWSALGDVQYAESYYAVTGARPDGKPESTLFVFGRTKTDPYVYYYRTFDPQFQQWDAWKKIEQTIAAPTISAVYAFRRLFIFWVEVESVTSSVITSNGSGPASQDQTTTRGAVKYSFLKNTGQWLQPQTLVDNVVIDFETDQYIIDNAPYMLSPLDVKKLWWNKVYPLHVLPSASGGATVSSEHIYIFYGFGLPVQKGVPFTISAPKATGNADQDVLNANVYTAVTRVNAMIEVLNKIQAPFTGHILYQQNRALDSRYVKHVDQATLLSYMAPEPQPYTPALDRTGQQLGINQSQDVLYDNYMSDNLALHPSSAGAPALALLNNVPGEVSGITMVKNQPGWFLFDSGDETFLVASQEAGLGKISEDLLNVRTSMQPFPGGELYLHCNAYTQTPLPFDQLKFAFTRTSTNVVAQLNERLIMGGLDDLLALDSQALPELPFNRFYPDPAKTPPNVIPPTSDTMDFSGAYGLYFWEIFFFAPFLVAERLKTNQQFDRARRWYQYIFNPTQPPDAQDQHPHDRFWRFLPFRSLSLPTIAQILTDPPQIAAYNDRPFDPDVIARLRPTAYQKAIVMRYIDNLLQWGDYLFAQDTREAITQATNLYVMAADLLGPRPRAVGACATPTSKTFADIQKTYGHDIPQFLIDLENVASTYLADGNVDHVYAAPPFNDIPSYFCVPENSEFLGYWDRVEDRLYKIRHCMNIKGVERALAQFAPPIDPRQLIRAAAGSNGGVLGGPQRSAAAPTPYYRFQVILEKARGLTSNVIQLGGALLGALEKQDAEALALLQLTQQRTVANLTTQIKQQQINELIKTRESLDASLASAAERANYYTELLLVGLSSTELLNIQAMILANIFNAIGSTMKTMAGVGYLVPNVGSPFAMTYGGRQVGSSLDAIGTFFEVVGGIQNFISALSQTMAGYERRAQEWQLQAALAVFDQQQIAAQIAATEVRETIAQREYEIHLTSIEQLQEMEQFLKGKFTNRELYQWMASQLATLYFQTYALALDMAQLAQRAYQYELNSSQSFVNFGYWDDLRKGLLAGEGLMLALDQMSKAYVEQSARPLEIEKTISLLQLDPKALLDLKQTGQCVFSLSEKLFDDDFPGHYARKIKTIAVSIPAIVGPYQNVNATLTQQSNQVVLSVDKLDAAVNAVNFLLGGEAATEPDAAALRSNWWINQQIALSSGVNDSGLFELNFQDERYLPFEGTGAVSTWQLRMPLTTNRFDFDAISDVIIQLRYTAIDGGKAFRDKVTQLPALQSFSGARLFSMQQQYAQQWFTFLNDHHDPAVQQLAFDVPATIIPAHLKPGVKLRGFYFKLDTPADPASSNPYITFNVPDGQNPVAFIPQEDGAYSYMYATPPDLTTVVGARQIAFNLAAGYTPNSLRNDPNGFLKPEEVQNILLILFYSGEIDWSSASLRGQRPQR